MDLMQQVGVDINAAYPTMEQSVQFMALLMQQAPWQIFLVWAPSLLSLLRFALMLFADTVVHIHPVSIESDKQHESKPEQREQAGGPYLSLIHIFWLPAESYLRQRDDPSPPRSCPEFEYCPDRLRPERYPRDVYKRQTVFLYVYNTFYHITIFCT